MRGAPACFSIELATPNDAIKLPKKLRLFSDATRYLSRKGTLTLCSLGGVESLIDYRFAYDSSVSPCLLRLSIGMESAKDLIADMEQALSQE